MTKANNNPIHRGECHGNGAIMTKKQLFFLDISMGLISLTLVLVQLIKVISGTQNSSTVGAHGLRLRRDPASHRLRDLGATIEVAIILPMVPRYRDQHQCEIV